MMRKQLKRRFALTLLTFILLISNVPLAHAEYIAAEHTRDTGSPYYIMVNRQMNTVTIYELGDDGYYSVPCRAMICSTGRQGHATPLGSYALTGYKSLWTHMLDGSYGQYVSQFKGNLLIHSVCYTAKDPSTLIAEEYNMLGTVASLGCVRLQVVDAKWIFDNCPAGTRVTIYDSPDPGPLGKPARMVDAIRAEMENGWEPTDPREENPWRDMLPITLRGSLNLRRAELYADGKVTMICKLSLDLANITVPVPCGWFLDGEPIEGFQNDACRISDADRYSQITLSGEKLGAGEHVIEFRCNTKGLAHIEPYTMRAELLVLPDAEPEQLESPEDTALAGDDATGTASITQ